jgi:hypothetical protein
MMDTLKMFCGLMGVTAMCIPFLFVFQWWTKHIVVPYLSWIERVFS